MFRSAGSDNRISLEVTPNNKGRLICPCRLVNAKGRLEPYNRHVVSQGEYVNYCNAKQWRNQAALASTVLKSTLRLGGTKGLGAPCYSRGHVVVRGC
ncbi:hypothetical protein PoB_000208300 [Plakobranchus ocellatus]|uniref:Uncharacterized protein n=1 Tax=Plakobranchus ocellatus TaxID=259542 RepID=A0AAV3Y023_9GAST|nr:hypothetical protein PoB_000208300 [Plakobranchus ocellatus]